MGLCEFLEHHKTNNSKNVTHTPIGGGCRWAIPKKEYKKLYKLRDLVKHYIKECDLGGGNFIPPKVYRDNKYIGWFSYNGKFWRESYPYFQ